MGHGEHTYYTQLSFSLSARLPVSLSAGDTLALPLTLKNNTAAPLSGTLHLSLPAGWETLGVSFRSDDHTDALREEVRILPRGFPAHRSYSGDALVATYAVDVNSPLPGTLKATLTAFPNTLSELTAGIECWRSRTGALNKPRRAPTPTCSCWACSGKRGAGRRRCGNGPPGTSKRVTSASSRSKPPKAASRVGETVRLTADVVNGTGGGLPMTMAVLGVPGGLGAQPWQLKALREEGLVDFYETRDNLVYLYFRQLPPGARKTIHLDLKAELPGTFEATASRAYLYYSDEVKSWSKPERITVLP